MNVMVSRIQIPAGSSIAYGYGVNESGKKVIFAGDHRPMKNIGRVLSMEVVPLQVKVEDSQIVSVAA